MGTRSIDVFNAVFVQNVSACKQNRLLIVAIVMYASKIDMLTLIWQICASPKRIIFSLSYFL